MAPSYNLYLRLTDDTNFKIYFGKIGGIKFLSFILYESFQEFFFLKSDDRNRTTNFLLTHFLYLVLLVIPNA